MNYNAKYLVIILGNSIDIIFIVEYGLRNKAGNNKLDVKRMRIIFLMFLLCDRNYESVRNIDKTNELSLIFQECVLVKINDWPNASSDKVCVILSVSMFQ